MKTLIIFVLGILLISNVSAYWDIIEASGFEGKAKYVINNRVTDKDVEAHLQQDEVSHPKNKVTRFFKKIYYLLFSGKERFKITKEECRNKTVTQDIPLPLHLFCAFKGNERECVREAEDKCLEVGGELWSDEDFSFTSYCMFYDWESEEEVCEQVEVDETELEMMRWYNIKDDEVEFLLMELCNRMGDSSVTQCLQKPNCYKYNENWSDCQQCCYLKLSKQSLTREFLLNNCVAHTDCEPKDEKGICTNTNVNKWECGDYLVEAI